jgi:tRNA A-37 threonylcarbamoyl transferase component Bud32
MPRIEGKYEVLRKLSEGGMGTIYLVRHRHLDELRVIKVLRPNFGAEGDLKDRFLREARVAIKLRHPNIAQLYDFSVDDEGTAFMVMEFIEGMTFEDFTRPERLLAPAVAVEMAQQGLRALGFLHRKGYVHRDISPDNLMVALDVDGQPHVKLIDLGIVKALADATQKSVAGMFLGKPRYASPEQLRGEPLDGRADLYSFGILCFELLTGRYPISGNDFASLVTGHLYLPPMEFAVADPGGRVPERLRSLVTRAMAKTPDERPSTAEAMVAELALCGLPEWRPLAADLLSRLESWRLAHPVPAAAPRSSHTTQEELNRQFHEARSTPATGTAIGDRPLALASTEVDRTLRLAGLREAIAAGELDRAEQLLAAAGVADTRDPALAGVENELRERIEERKRERVFQDGLAELDRLLAAERPREAAIRLRGLVAEHGSRAELVERDQKLEILARELRFAEVAGAARDAFDRGDWAAAREGLALAQQLRPDDAESKRLLMEVQERLAEARRAAEIRERIERGEAAVKKLLAGDRPEEAAQELVRLRAESGDTDGSAALQLLVDAALAQRRENEYRTEIARAERDLARGRIDEAEEALARARRWRDLAPEHAALAERVAREAATAHPERELGDMVSRVLAEVDRLLAEGDAENALATAEELLRMPVWELPPGVQSSLQTTLDRARTARILELGAIARRQLAEGSRLDADYTLDRARQVDPRHPEVRRLAAEIAGARDRPGGST